MKDSQSQLSRLAFRNWPTALKWIAGILAALLLLAVGGYASFFTYLVGGIAINAVQHLWLPGLAVVVLAAAFGVWHEGEKAGGNKSITARARRGGRCSRSMRRRKVAASGPPCAGSIR